MKLINLAVPTGVIKTGMSIKEVFSECIKYNVPGLPFVDETGKITGRVSIRDIIKNTCLPDYVINAAEYLGDDIHNVNVPKLHCQDILLRDVEDYVLDNMATVTSDSPVVKGLAIMEYYNSNYIFLLDHDEYKGVVTRMAIIRRFLDDCNKP